MSDKLNENSVNENDELLEKEVEEVKEEAAEVKKDAADDKPEINAENPKYEENDNWEFEATAHTLDDTFIENDEMIIEIPKKEEKETPVQETRERPKVADKEEKKEKEPKAKGDVRNRTIFLMIAIFGALVIGALVFLGVRYYTVPATIGASETHEVTNPGNVALDIKGTKVTAGMYSYYYNQIVTSYASQAQQGYVEFDVNKDFEKQTVEDEDGKKVTWKKKIDDETVNWLKQLVAYYSKGKEEGLKLSEEEKKTIDEEIETVKKTAEESDIPLEDYITTTYGDYVTLATLRNSNEWYIIAQNYARKMATELRPTVKEAEDYYKKHENDFLQVNFSILPMIYQENNKDKVVKQAKKYAKQVKTADDVKKLVPKACKDLIDQYVESGQFKDAESVEVEIAKSTDASVSKDNPNQYPEEIINFLFNEKNKVGSSTVIVDDQYAAVYIILKQSDASPIKDDKYSVRHILISPTADEDEKEEEEGDDHSDDNSEPTKEQWTAAEKKANDIYQEYLQGERTEYKFALLAEENSDDPGSISSGGQGAFGGLYYKQEPGTMVKEFEKWILDKNRKYGDTGIIKTKFGYHIMYFVDKQPDYIMDCLTAVSMEMEDEFINSYTVKPHDYVLNKVIEAVNAKVIKDFKANQAAQEAADTQGTGSYSVPEDEEGDTAAEDAQTEKELEEQEAAEGEDLGGVGD